jgi:hypothetical protein
MGRGGSDHNNTWKSSFIFLYSYSKNDRLERGPLGFSMVGTKKLKISILDNYLPQNADLDYFCTTLSKKGNFTL